MVKKMIPKRIVTEVFIADDGTEFNSEYECDRYERKAAERTLRKRIEDWEYDFSGCLDRPYLSYVNDDCYEYMWFLIDSEEKKQVLSECFHIDLESVPVYNDSEETMDIINSIICVENESWDGDSWLYLFSELLEDMRSHLDAFGLKIVKGD